MTWYGKCFSGQCVRWNGAASQKGEHVMPAIPRPFVVLAFVIVGACATGHSAMNGSVIMKVSETEAHVCLLDSDAPIGTRVQLYRHDCKSQYAKPGTPSSARTPYVCEKQAVGVGTISQKIGGHYVVVTFPAGTQYEEGYTIERLSKTAPDVSASR
jgi:hypothetical protein